MASAITKRASQREKDTAEDPSSSKQSKDKMFDPEATLFRGSHTTRGLLEPNTGPVVWEHSSGRRPRAGSLYSSPLNHSNVVFYVGLALVTVVALATRLYMISQPEHVAWDETHFGKHASWYIQGKFFFDVHPPLGKLMIAIGGVLTGYNGSFEFKEPGQKYEDHPYIGMRVMCALLGALVVPLAYLTVWELVQSTTAAILTGAIIICETGTLILSQYILLDPLLLFFVMAATFCTARFRNCKDEPFDLEWWYWLLLSGLFLACAFSVKWVGLFVIALVGLSTVKDLWDMLGDFGNKMMTLVYHFLARAVFLILWPVIIYLAIFQFHFLVLSYSGNGDGFFSSEFQSTLFGNELNEMQVPEHVGYGAVITLKNRRPGGGLLHSHSHLYPEEFGEFQQQQVTAYTHKDDNNKWIVRRIANQSNTSDSPHTETDLVTHGDWVVLEHLSTQRNLHSHSQKAPMTPTHLQVTCYGEQGHGDTNDYWMVELEGGRQGDAVKTVASVLKFRHVNTGCYLHSHGTQLPKWGWEQLEVTCNPRAHDRNNLWNVEGNINDKLPMVSFEFYKPNFISKFIEAHIVMAEGQLFSGGDYRVYLLGNPPQVKTSLIIFWGCDLLLLVFLAIVVTKLILDQRGFSYPRIAGSVNRFVEGGCWLVVGWALHYLPFYLMGRVLYFHHYFPALMFCCMLGAIVSEFCLRLVTHLLGPSIRGFFYHSALVLLVSIVIGSFVVFKPLAYGMTGPRADDPKSSMYGLKWLSTWEI